MTEEKVIALRKMSADGWNNADLGRHFGIDKTQARNIVIRKHWIHV